MLFDSEGAEKLFSIQHNFTLLLTLNYILYSKGDETGIINGYHTMYIVFTPESALAVLT
jgi:hypothetical protein